MDFVCYVADVVIAIDTETSVGKLTPTAYQHLGVRSKILLPAVMDNTFPEYIMDWVDNVKDSHFSCYHQPKEE